MKHLSTITLGVFCALSTVASAQIHTSAAPTRPKSHGSALPPPAPGAGGGSSSLLPPGANDDCNSPTIVTGSGVFPLDTTSATTGSQGQSEVLCDQNGFVGTWNDVWFSWTAGCNGLATLSTCGSVSYDSKLAVYPGSGCPASGSAIACNDDFCGAASEVTFACVAGNNYLFQIGSFPGTIAAPGSFSILCGSTVPGDDCATPTIIAGAGPHSVNTVLASTGIQGQANGACIAIGSPAIDRDVWFEWTATERGTVTLDFCGAASSFDTKVAVYRDSGCPSTFAIACNDDSTCGLRSRVCFEADEGETFVFQVGSYPGTPGGTAAFTLMISVPDVMVCGLDDGSAETGVGYAPIGGMGWMQRFGELGETRTVHSVATAFGSLAAAGLAPANGSPAKVAVWEDPNDDGDPSDAVLLAVEDIVVSEVDTDHLIAYHLATPVTVSGRYFIGAGLAHGTNQFPAPLDAPSCAAAGRAFAFGDATGTLNFAALGANDFPPQALEIALGYAGAWLLRPDCFEVQDECETLVTASESTYSNAYWQDQTISGPGGSSFPYASPGSSNVRRRIVHAPSAPSTLACWLANESIYPAADGAVLTVDVSASVRAGLGGGSFALALKQNSTWYASPFVSVPFLHWGHVSLQGLTAPNFVVLQGTPTPIDFSCNAPPITVGFYTQKTAGQFNTLFDVDDFRVDFHGLACVSPCCDEEAVVDAQGNPVYPVGLFEQPPAENIDEDRGDVRDLYGSQATNTVGWTQDIGCPTSLGGTPPSGATSPDLLSALAALGITGYTPQQIQDAVLGWENQIANTELGYQNSLPTAGSVTGGAAYTPPAIPHAPTGGECYAFGGRDIVFVHDIQFEHILDGMVNGCAANAHWSTPSQFPGSTSNPEYYGTGYFKRAAERAWSAHIQKFFAQAAPNGIKNRYLVVCYSSNDRADVAAQAILTQISDAMRFGTGVVDPTGNGDTTKFGTPSFVTISQGLGSLYTDVAYAAAALHANLDAGFIADHAKAHVSLHGAFKGSRYATALIAAWGYVAVSDPSLAAKICVAIWAAQGLAETAGLGCAPDVSLSCLISGPIVQNTALLDMVPLVIEAKWTQYLDNVPVPTVTVAGGHPTMLFPLKNLLAPGFDDGLLTVDSQCAKRNFVALWPSLLQVKNEGVNVPPLIYSRMFDMGLANDDGRLRAIGLYIDQVIDRLVVTTGFGPLLGVLHPMHIASAATPFYSPAGMIESIPPSSMYNPRTDPAFFPALNFHAKHYTFIQSTADHFTGTNGRILPFQPNNRYWSTGGTWWNDEETFVVTDNAMFQNYSTSGYAGDDDPLLRVVDMPSIHEIVRGKKIWVPVIQHWKIKWKPKWLWKRTYHQPVDMADKHQCDYVYGMLLKGDSAPCDQTGIAYCTCDHGNGPCYPNVADSGPGRGCRNSTPGNPGGLLKGSGVPDRSQDAAGINRVVLTASDVTTVGLLFQGTLPIQSGIPFGDGLLCIGGTITRLKVVLGTGGTLAYPQAGDPPLSIVGAVPLTGGTYHYQIWYRDPPPAHCPSATFNLTNAYSVTWSP